MSTFNTPAGAVSIISRVPERPHCEGPKTGRNRQRIVSMQPFGDPRLEQRPS
jgi:hypothetical protein